MKYNYQDTEIISLDSISQDNINTWIKKFQYDFDFELTTEIIKKAIEYDLLFMACAGFMPSEILSEYESENLSEGTKNGLIEGIKKTQS